MLRVFQMWMMLFLTDNNDVVFEHVAADVVDVAAGCAADLLWLLLAVLVAAPGVAVVC